MIYISILLHNAFECMHLFFIKSNTTHAASWITILRTCGDPSAWQPSPYSITLWLSVIKKIGLIWQGKMCPIYNTGKCKQGSFTSTPIHSEQLLLRLTSPFFTAVWLPFMVGRGHFTFIHVRKLVAIAQPHCLHIHLYINICHIVSVYFSHIGLDVISVVLR